MTTRDEAIAIIDGWQWGHPDAAAELFDRILALLPPREPTPPPEVMASLDDYARTLLRTGHAGDLENARNKHLAALVAAIEAAEGACERKWQNRMRTRP